jgi:hypothetical protein
MGVLAKRNIPAAVRTEPLPCQLKLSLFLIKHNAMKTYGSYGGIAHAFEYRFNSEKNP